MSEGPTGVGEKYLRRGRATRWKAGEDRTGLVAGLQGHPMKVLVQSRTLSEHRCVPAFETFVLPFARNESDIGKLLAPVLELSGGDQHEIELRSRDFSSCVVPFARQTIRLLSWMMCRLVRIDSEKGWAESSTVNWRNKEADSKCVLGSPGAGRKAGFFSCWRSSFLRRCYWIWPS